MKTLTIIAILIFSSILFIENAQSQTMNYDTKYAFTIFEEDFSGSIIDSNKWNVEDAYKRGIGLLIDSSATVKDTNGNLELSMINCPNCEVTTWDGITFNGDYAGGEIISKAAFQYGIFECRAKLAQNSGSWPAIWI